MPQLIKGCSPTLYKSGYVLLSDQGCARRICKMFSDSTLPSDSDLSEKMAQRFCMTPSEAPSIDALVAAGPTEEHPSTYLGPLEKIAAICK